MGNSKSKAEARQREIEERRARQEAERKRKEEEERKKQIEKLLLQKFDVTLQSATRGFLARHFYDKLKATAIRRRKIAEEILSTEKSYVKNLQLVIGLFFHPLQVAAAHQEDLTTRGFKKARTKATFKDKGDLEKHYKDIQKGGSDKIQRRSTFTELEKEKIVSSNSVEDVSFTGTIPEIPGITKDHVRNMFSQVEVIMLYNEKLQVTLEERISQWSWYSRLGDLFLEMMDFLKVYINYVNNYNAALETLDKLKSIPEFVTWLSKTESKPECNGNGIDSFLIMPIQRIPRYVLLLEDLKKSTPEEHIDRKQLEEATDKMKSIAQLINEKKKQAESFVKIVDIYNRLDPKIEDLCEPHRLFLKEGLFKEEDNIFTFFLFNDILLKTREKDKGKLKMILQISLATAEIIDIADDNKLKIKNSFQVVTSRNKIMMTAKSPEEKKEWLDVLLDCKKKLLEKTKSYVQLQSSNSRTSTGSLKIDGKVEIN